MEYAAVIIPTLNRIDHLKRCVNSLLKNAEAQNTDLYISVDYPPADKYRVGYEEVKKYVKTISGFKNVYIYFQERNLGPGLNRKFLEDKLATNHDKFVFTDDDNEFSDNFLAYVNWGLELFKNDEDIYAICSKADFDVVRETEADYLVLPFYNPYGAGHWIHKCKKCEQYLNQDNISEIYRSEELKGRILFYSPILLYYLATDAIRMHPDMRGKGDNITYIDIWENIYCTVNNKQCIIPFVAKSRNWGYDGTGVHAIEYQNVDVKTEELDEAKTWTECPRKSSEAYKEKNRVSHVQKFSYTSRQERKCRIVFGGYNTLGEKGFEKLVNLYKKFRKKKNGNNKQVFYG